MAIRSVASSKVGVILRMVSNCDIEINFETDRCRPQRTKEPPAFLHKRFATKIALKPELSQYLVSPKSMMIFLNSSALSTTSSDLSDGEIKEDYMYFKAGVYNQNKLVDEVDADGEEGSDGIDDYGAETSDYVQATFYELTTTHY